MGLIAWIVVGAIIGGAANWIMKRWLRPDRLRRDRDRRARSSPGYVGNAVTGQTDGFSLSFVSLIMAIFFAIIVVGVGKTALGRGGEA